MAKRVVTITINADGKEVREATKDIERLNDGLHDLDVRQAKEAQQTLKSLGHTDLTHTIQHIREIKQSTSQIDDSQIKQAQTAIKELGSDAQRTADVYRDASGRLRDANGKFVKSANDAKQAANGLGNEVAKTARQFDKLKDAGASVQSFGGQVTGIGQSLTLALTAPTIAIATFGITSQANLEKAEVSFARFIKNSSGFSGSLEDARREAQLLMKDLQSFSDTTPFESEEVISSGRKLLAAKIPRQEIQGFLKDAGDLAAAANANIEDVAGAMSRLKSGDFGEAFERFRDFGISKEDLTAKGLEFDKGGSFKGSADEAMTAVRAIIKERFGDTMNDLSQTLSGRFSTLMDKGKGFFRELFQPAFEYAKPAVDFIAGKLEFLTAYLTTISPQAKLLIVAVLGGVAALGPILVIIGAIITAVGMFISSVGAIAGVWATITAAVTAAGGVFAAIGTLFTGTIIPALAAAAPVILGVIAVVGALVAVGTALYFAWSTNFGGIRDLTTDVFNSIQESVGTGLAYVQQLWAQYGDQIITTATNAFNGIIEFIRPIMTEIVSFIREAWQTIVAVAGPLLTQLVTVVKTQMTALMAGIQVVLTVISTLWTNHGEQIKAVVSAVWNILKTIVLTAIRQIGNVITLVLAVINGDWAQAWESLKAIVKTSIDATLSILSSLGTIIWNLLKASFDFFNNLASWVAEKAVAVGKAIIEGIVNGIASGARWIADAAWDLGKTAINSLKGAIDSNSPSRETFKEGINFTQGFAFGTEKEIPLVKEKVKKVAKTALGELQKQVADAARDFNFLAGSQEAQNLTVQSSDYQDAKSKLEELIKLRARLGVNQGFTLPTTSGALQAEIDAIKQQEEGLKKAQEILKGFEDSLNGIGKEQTNLEKVNALLADSSRNVFIDETTAALLREKAAMVDAAEAAKKLKEAKEAITKNGFNERVDLQTQIDSYAVNVNTGAFEQITDEVEIERIKRAGEMLKWLEENKSKWSAQELADLQKLKEAENERYLELLKQLQAQKDLAAASKAYSDLNKELDGNLAELNEKLAGNTELTEANRVAKLLETEAYKSLTAEQRENLLVKAKEIDQRKEEIKAAEEAKKEFERTANALSDSLLRIFQAGARGGFKGFLSQILEELKDFGSKLLDNVLSELSNRLSKFLLGKIFGGGSSSGGIGGFFSNLLGGGSMSSGSSSGGGIFGSIRNFFGFGGSSSGGGMSGGAAAANSPNSMPGGGGFGLSGAMAVGGMAAQVLGGMLGGVAGQTISMAGTGLGIGMMFGGPVGGAIGAGIGAIAGFLTGIFGRNSLRKKEEKARTQYINEAIAGIGGLDQILADVKAQKFNPPSDALKQADELIRRIKDQYLSAASSLKDKKTRGIAINDAYRIDDVAKPKLEAIRQAVKNAEIYGDVTRRLGTAQFANGVYLDAAFLRQYGEFKQRNGMLAGAFTGRDTLPSMLAAGEMVLNPSQIAQVIRNANYRDGGDPFERAGIPGYNTGVYVPTPTAPNLALSAPSNSSSSKTVFAPNITVVLEGEGVSIARIKQVLVDGMEDTDVQVKIAEAGRRGARYGGGNR